MLVQSSSTTLAGLGGDAKSGMTKEEAKTFADQSVAALAAAVKRGEVVPSELREPDQGAGWLGFTGWDWLPTGLPRLPRGMRRTIQRRVKRTATRKKCHR
jgi:hypothetical protein